jgi:hypothetical protein
MHAANIVLRYYERYLGLIYLLILNLYILSRSFGAALEYVPEITVVEGNREDIPFLPLATVQGEYPGVSCNNNISITQYNTLIAQAVGGNVPLPS